MRPSASAQPLTTALCRAAFLSYFAELPKLVLTEKLDGQNNCFAAHGLYARSHTAPTQHPWDKPLLQRWQQIKDDLGDLELFGEKTKSSTATIWRRMGREGEK